MFNWIDADLPLILIRPTEFDQPIGEGKNSMIFAQANVVPRMDTGSPLPHQDIPRSYQLAIKLFDAEPLGLAIPA
jgi:hypothetical protein